MAFIPQGQREQEEGQQNQNQFQQTPLIPTLQGSGGPSVGQGSSGTGVQNTASPAAAPTSPWQNVSAYLQANAGQAGKVADTISGNLQGQYNTANQGIQSAQQNFGQQIESARVPYNEQLAGQAAQAPGSFVQDPNNVAAFQKMYNAQYQGPQSFSGSNDYADLQSKVQKGQQQAGLVNQGSKGIMTLLQQAENVNGRAPTQGMTTLDSLLLQEDPSNFTTLTKAAAPFSGLTDYLAQTQEGLDTAAHGAASEAAQTQAKLQGQFIGPGGVAPAFSKRITDALNKASTGATNYNQTISDITSDLNAGKPLQSNYPDWIGQNVDPSGTLQTLNPFGTSGGVFQSMLGMGLGVGVGPNYLTQFYNAPKQIQQPGLENVMSQQDLADAQALNQLVGAGTVQAPDALGQQFQVPQGFGSFNSQGALQGLVNSLQDQQSFLPYMTADQQNAWLRDLNQLQSYMGIPTTTNPIPTPINPTPPPPPGTGPGAGDGGDIFLQPPALQPPGGGGHVFF